MVRALFNRSTKHFSGLLVGKIFSTIVFVFVARTLQTKDYGSLVLFMTIVQLVTIIADFGLKQWYQKNAHIIGRSKSFNQAFNARVFTFLLSILLLGIYLRLAKPFNFNTSLFLILITLPEALLSLSEAYYLEIKQSTKVGLKNISIMIVFIFSWWLSSFSVSLDLLVMFWFSGSFFTFLWFFPWSGSEFSFLGFPKIIKILTKSKSYALLTSTALLYARGDQIILEKIRGSFALGIYGAAYRYLDALSLFPSTIIQNLFPQAAKKGAVSYREVKKITLIIFLMGFVLSVLLFFSSAFLTTFLLGEQYSSASNVLKIFSLVLLLFFVNAPLSSIVQSSNFVGKFLPFGIVNTIFNIILNLMFIPIYGVIASAWIMVFTEFSGLLINLYFIKRIYKK